VNPQIGSGTIAATSVAGTRSRFGVPLDQAPTLVEAFRRYPWLNGVHSHVGSQGCSLAQLVEAAVRVEQLVLSIEAACGRRLERIDLGGGLPVAYRSNDTPPSMEAYSEALRAAAPNLLDRPLATEFGRWIHANAGWVVSRAEYVKNVGGERHIVLHVGADLLLRVAYRPESWPHEFIVLDAHGEPRHGDERPQTIVGPLCFAGDVLAQSVLLPTVHEGDLIVIRDTGAYTLSMWSRHCSRGIPTVIGSDASDVRVLRRRESARDVVRFWEGS
jgi:diaminopimelate decarboxylase